jgi:hypothetical protein
MDNTLSNGTFGQKFIVRRSPFYFRFSNSFSWLLSPHTPSHASIHIDQPGIDASFATLLPPGATP